LTPSVGYYHKGGLGINITCMIIKDSGSLNPYQLLATGSYDYLTAKNFIAGINFTRFFTKPHLSFYTSPLQNELGAYFTYRKWWIKPSVTARYGWGSRSAVQERQEYITSLRLRPYGFTRVSSTESISDFSVAASLRHDFYKLDIVGKRTVLRVTPQVNFTAGTQNFGLNQSSDTYGTIRSSNNPVLFNSAESYLDSKLYFQPLAAAVFLKTELTVGKAFIQPQVAFNYYFPATDKHFSSIITVNAGFIF
ncbi:MAG: hypothetical protein JWP88_967, partial [Flaviaesturariibacter sp.]|nr:hypothetical protein [Flaviaesturariibacter sp.]